MRRDRSSPPFEITKPLPPVVSFVGRSGSGKTRFLERLIAVLTARGHRVGALKHHAHEIEVDKPGKDTHRLAAAGAERVSLSGPGRNAYFEAFEGEKPAPEVVARFFGGLDIVITEGFKKGPYPKIEVARKDVSEDLICGPDEGLIAVVSDFSLTTPVPQLPLDDPERAADFLEERVMFSDQTTQWKLTLIVDGKPIPIKEFVRDVFINVSLGMVDTLKGVPEQPDKVTITLERK